MLAPKLPFLKIVPRGWIHNNKLLNIPLACVQNRFSRHWEEGTAPEITEWMTITAFHSMYRSRNRQDYFLHDFLSLITLQLPEKDEVLKGWIRNSPLRIHQIIICGATCWKISFFIVRIIIIYRLRFWYSQVLSHIVNIFTKGYLYHHIPIAQLLFRLVGWVHYIT